jgi:hypothetical protein
MSPMNQRLLRPQRDARLTSSMLRVYPYNEWGLYRFANNFMYYDQDDGETYPIEDVMSLYYFCQDRDIAMRVEWKAVAVLQYADWSTWNQPGYMEQATPITPSYLIADIDTDGAGPLFSAIGAPMNFLYGWNIRDKAIVPSQLVANLPFHEWLVPPVDFSEIIVLSRTVDVTAYPGLFTQFGDEQWYYYIAVGQVAQVITESNVPFADTIENPPGSFPVPEDGPLPDGGWNYGGISP